MASKNDLIKKVLDEEFTGKVKLNKSTDKIWFGSRKMIAADYDDIQSICEQKSIEDDWKDYRFKFSKAEIKNYVQKYAYDHVWEPGNKKEEPELEEWATHVRWGEKGKAINEPANIIQFIINHPMWKGRIKFDTFYGDVSVDGHLMNSTEWSLLCNSIGDYLKIDVSREKVMNCLNGLSMIPEMRGNVVVDYLESLDWDGIERIPTFFHDWVGAVDNALNREKTRLMFAGLIARACNPGVKYDYMTVLKGRQGFAKSTVFEFLVLIPGVSGLYTETLDPDKDPKDYLPQCKQAWIVNIDELQFGQKAQEKIKSFITRRVDKGVEKFKGSVTEVPRHFILVATTNEQRFLMDNTQLDERRYMVIEMGTDNKWKYKVHEEFTSDVRDQVLAEAYHNYKYGVNNSLLFNPRLYDDFVSDQMRYKQICNEEELDLLKELVDMPVENGEAVSADDYIKKTMEDDNGFTVISPKQMDVIPCSWLNARIKVDRKFDFKYKNIRLMMSVLGWEQKKMWYKPIKNAITCWVRGSSSLFGVE